MSKDKRRTIVKPVKRGSACGCSQPLTRGIASVSRHKLTIFFRLADHLSRELIVQVAFLGFCVDRRIYIVFSSAQANVIQAEKRGKGRTGWPQHVWALELKHDA